MIKYSETIAQNAREPIDLQEAVNHAKALPDDEEYALVDGYITAAREYCEGITGRSLIARNMVAYLDGAAGTVYLPKPPVMTVESVKVYDENGNAYEARSNIVDAVNGEVMLSGIPAINMRKHNPIEVKYTTGYTKVPGLMRQAMLLLIGHWYMNREAVVVGPNASVEVGITTRTLLRQFKAWWM